MHRAFAALAFVLIHAIALAGWLPDADRAQLVQRVFQGFWGAARNPAGDLIQPTDERDRNTIPVDDAMVQRSLDAGEISGLAQWCRLDWEPHFLSLTRSVRAKRGPEKQVAFVAMLHGAAQGRMESVMKNQTCTPAHKERIQRMMQESLDQNRKAAREAVQKG